MHVGLRRERIANKDLIFQNKIKFDPFEPPILYAASQQVLKVDWQALSKVDREKIYALYWLSTLLLENNFSQMDWSVYSLNTT